MDMHYGYTAVNVSASVERGVLSESGDKEASRSQ